jgi:amino acid permease
VDELGQPLEGDVRLNDATAALASTIIGAGIMALPRAFATLGLVVGGALLALVFALSLFSLSALVTVARDTRQWTYAALARSQFGALGAGLLQLAIVVNNSGTMIIYLIIIGDVLCGVAPDYNGLVTDALGIHDPSVFYVSRPFVVSEGVVGAGAQSMRLVGPGADTLF